MNIPVMNPIAKLATLMLLLAAAPPLLAQQAPRDLFDGESLKGWETIAADQKWWRVDGEMIVGGSLEEQVPHNTFLSTLESFHNFDLEFDILIEGNGGFITPVFRSAANASMVVPK